MYRAKISTIKPYERPYVNTRMDRMQRNSLKENNESVIPSYKPPLIVSPTNQQRQSATIDATNSLEINSTDTKTTSKGVQPEKSSKKNNKKQLPAKRSKKKNNTSTRPHSMRPPKGKGGKDKSTEESGMDNGEKMPITGDASTNNIIDKTKTLSEAESRKEDTTIAGTVDDNQKTDKESSQGKTEEAKPSKANHEVGKIEEKDTVEDKKKKKNSAKPNVYSRIKILEDKLKVLVEAAEQNKRIPKTSNDQMTTDAVRHPVEQRNRHHIQTVSRGGGNAHSNAGTYHNRRNYQQKQTQNWNRQELYYQPYDDPYWRQRNKSYVSRGNFNQGGRGTRYRRNDYRQFYNNARYYGNNYNRYQNRFD